MKIKELLRKILPVEYYFEGKKNLTNPHYLEVQDMISKEVSKSPSRTQVINFLLSIQQRDTHYLEIGVRNPDHNFDHINANHKYSVDPGVEFEKNPVDFKLTSDDFFQKLTDNEILTADTKFDVIFIDGLHLAEQVDRDIQNALKFIKDDGFVVLHDCNPPSEWHARESYEYFNTPAHGYWNGTTWKAFLKWRSSSEVESCCIDTDWGVGILSKHFKMDNHQKVENAFFEFKVLESNRKNLLNLVDFDSFKKNIESQLVHQ